MKLRVFVYSKDPESLYTHATFGVCVLMQPFESFGNFGYHCFLQSVEQLCQSLFLVQLSQIFGSTIFDHLILEIVELVDPVYYWRIENPIVSECHKKSWL